MATTPTHPLDTELRARLRAHKMKQSTLAQRIGRKPAWLNKYIHGAGHATVDDVIRIVAVLSGLDAPRLTVAEQQLLHQWRRLKTTEAQQAVLDHLDFVAGRRPGSAARPVRPAPGTTHKGSGKP